MAFVPYKYRAQAEAIRKARDIAEATHEGELARLRAGTPSVPATEIVTTSAVPVPVAPSPLSPGVMGQAWNVGSGGDYYTGDFSTIYGQEKTQSGADSRDQEYARSDEVQASGRRKTRSKKAPPKKKRASGTKRKGGSKTKGAKKAPKQNNQTKLW